MNSMLDAFPAIPADLAQTKDDVLELARAWDRGDLPLGELRRLCNGAERYACRRQVGRDDPDHPLLVRLFDALVDSETSQATGRIHRTPFGCFTESELIAPWLFDQFINRVRARYEMERG